ncbi:mesenchyme-specific cell surface glycoprotein-like [Diadema setosum]|uniref:mesenchyme-specific cell surface glycoprotein-like n=1 Tax=Diadema setosum TaxID=31175 RepID=UPI003B3B3D4C
MGLLRILSVFLLSIHGAFAVWTLQKLSTQYVPADYINAAEPTYVYDGGAVNSVVYDPVTSYAYVAGDKHVQVVDFARFRRPDIVAKVKSTGGAVTNIAQCGYFVAWLTRGASITDPGTLTIYDSYRRVSKKWNMLCSAQVGSDPVHLRFFHDCSTIVVANKGTAAGDASAGTFTNPEGTVSIVRLYPNSGNQQLPPNGPPAGPGVPQNCGTAAPFRMTISTIDFTRFNDPKFAPYLSFVRTPYDGSLDSSTPTFSQGVEPYYVTGDPTYNSAYVSLRENNAIVQINLEYGNETVSAFNSLRTKEWFQLNLDATNAPQPGPSFGRYDISSLRQAAAIEPFERKTGWNMLDTYLLTADQGAMTRYSFEGRTWSDAIRGARLENAPAALQADLQDPEKLGKLMVSKVDGRSDPSNPQSPINRLHFFGSRGISLFKFNGTTSDLEFVWDSGDIIATAVQETFPDVFNSKSKTADAQSHGPASQADKASMSLGAECKSLAIGQVAGTDLVFVGVDGPSVIAIFSVGANNVTPAFESVYRNAPTTPEFSILMDAKTIGDVDPATLQFIPPSKTIDKNAYLMVGGKKSGTVTMYRVTNEPRKLMIARLKKEAAMSRSGAASRPSPLPAVLLSLLLAAATRFM